MLNRFQGLSLILFIFAIISTQSYCVTNDKEIKNEVILEEFIYNKAPFPGCHASTIAEIPDGIVAHGSGELMKKIKMSKSGSAEKLTINGQNRNPLQTGFNEMVNVIHAGIPYCSKYQAEN